MIDWLKKYAVYIKVGFIIALTGVVIAYVWKKNSLRSDLIDSDIDAIMQSGLGELAEISGRIRDNDIEIRNSIAESAERNRQIINSLNRAESRIARSENRSAELEAISRRAIERNKEATELAGRARDLLAELRNRIQ